MYVCIHDKKTYKTPAIPWQPKKSSDLNPEETPK